MSTINKVIKNFLSISFANISSQVVTFLIVAYYARILGASIFGDIATVQAILVYFTMFVMLGLQTYGIREISKSGLETERIVGNIISLRIVAFFISYGLLLILTIINKGNVVLNKLILMYGIMLLPSAINFEWIFSGLQEMQHNAVYNLIKNLFPCILIYLFLKSKDQFYFIPIFTSIGLFSALAYHIYIYFFSKKLKISFTLKKADIKKYLVYGYPFMLSGVLATLNGNVDRIIIKFTRSSMEAGVYYAGYSIILFLTSVITLLFTPVFPLIIRYFHTKEFDNLKRILENTIRITAVIALPIVAGGIALSKEIILFLFGQEYAGGYVSFAILLLYILILFIREIYGYCLNSWNSEAAYLKVVFISSMVNVVLNMILTPFYGMNIAALITVLSELINLYLMRKYANRIYKLNVFYFFRKSVAPSLLMIASILLLKYFGLHVLVIICIAIIVYFVSVFCLKVISLGDLKKVLSKKE